MSNEASLDRLLSSGIVAVIRKVDPKKVPPLIQAFVDGGVSGIEITMDSNHSTALINELKQVHGNKVMIGAGTVLNKEQAKEAIEAGSDFIFAPILDRETIEFTKKQGILMIPGVFTPTEIHQAYQWGADMVKVFPASVVGPRFFKDVKGPISQIPMMPTGGVNLDNIGAFIQAGAVTVGIGGSLVDKSLIEQEDWKALRNLAQQYVEKIAEVRNSK
ncbi:bifunctional 4-hydroxy-2-oxoglutarate aldolase/2-dehydro-3-deoxy-phosphogluconate aldolase [Salinibacillus xinjiangensis]|uniref:Bifunctional 4-hydroxy-2-oxoglutarate aldolase/2-dehydro-3-deoxy-phosphogluconate aldolase n=1 Tax=Salinibacillus xinjiangensis TaxID=1229268 RepID=A0A6G1X237_9BACI|nr:bifunctional 4-hydroxy-2-oxoglutarate aldolase/2-dehydro-3-deoxy-phosphogluconate aldolase [Salinibacillus xinjiangensis]MRG84955.1 bifunctional 4-hydroxy-2-oxoglutarate aldolase/2-dehydro-3-deoxy-phosphogluconate aldolase [Salinibacillus xinjiangensis]